MHNSFPQLSAFLKQFGLNESNGLNHLTELFIHTELKKGESFAKKGEYAKKIGFVEAGVLRAYFGTDDGESYNKSFFSAGSFIGAYSSLVTGNKNLIDIDCLTPCRILVADYKSVVALFNSFTAVERMARILAEQFFVSKEKREIELVTLEAKERYQIFKENIPV